MEQGGSTRLRSLRAVTDPSLAALPTGDLLAELAVRACTALGSTGCAIVVRGGATYGSDDAELRALAEQSIAAGAVVTAQAGVAVPLHDALGAVAVRAAHLADDDLDALHLVAAGAAVAVERATRRRLEELQQLTDAALAHRDLGDLIDELERRIQAILGVDTVAIRLSEHEPDEPGVPLLVDGNPIGVLQVGGPPDDVDLLQLVADRAALAIEHARAFEAERFARRRLEDVQSVTDAALAHLDLEDLLEELLLRIRSILGADTAAILLLDEERDELVARAAKGIEEEVEAGVRVPLGRGFAGRIAATREPVILERVDLQHVVNPILVEKGIASLLGVPLIAHDHVVGVLHVGTLRPREFDADDVQLLQLVADRAALAIERSRLHEETLQLDELERNFVAIASHELRTPAASVYGALATLRSRDLPEETRRQLADIAWQESDRMRRLIEQLLDLSRLDAGRVRLQPQRVDLSSFLTGLVGVEPDVVVQANGRVQAEVDTLVLERVLSNLVSNARLYGKPPITLCAERAGGQLRIVVEDGGQGVPLGLVPRLFDRFVRGGEGHGSGLGLAIARAYTRAHGGELRYARVARGARFEIVLPNA